MIKLFKSPYVNGEPLEYMVSSTDGVVPVNAMVVQTSTAQGFGSANASTYLNTATARYFLAMKATTGSTSIAYPIQPIMPNTFYKVDHSTAEAVVGTSAQGYVCTISSSGAATVGTTGSFRISTVHNTSDTSEQYFIGQFLLRTSTAF